METGGVHQLEPLTLVKEHIIFQMFNSVQKPKCKNDNKSLCLPEK